MLGKLNNLHSADSNEVALGSLADLSSATSDMEWLLVLVIVSSIFGRAEALTYDSRTGPVKGLMETRTKSFIELLPSLESSDKGAKIMMKIRRAIFSLSAHYYRLHGGSFEEDVACPGRLLGMIKNKFNCPVTANELEPHLHNLEIVDAMKTNMHFYESISITYNCTKLIGRYMQLCELAVSKDPPSRLMNDDDVNQGIHKCFIEENQNQTHNMTKRYKNHLNYVAGGGH